MEDHDEIVSMRAQINRLVSDADSEKDTRRRTNESFDDKLRYIHERLNKHQFWFGLGIGGGWVAAFLLELLHK